MIIKKLNTFGFWLVAFGLLLGVSKPPNYVTQSNEGKLFTDEELAEDFKLKFKFEGGDRYTIQKLLTNPECLEEDVLNLLLGFDPYTGRIDKILQNPQEVEKVKNTFQKAIECAREYLEKIQNEKSSGSFQNSEDEKIKNDYDEFNKVNEKLYTCSYKVLRCLACKQDCERFGVVDKSGNYSKVGLQNSTRCYDHCLSAISILPPPRQSRFCEKCLDNFFVTDRELCDEECDYNPFNKCATMSGEFQKCINTCKEKFDRNTELPDFEDCIQKCSADMDKKYSKILAKKSDIALTICLNLPIVFENINLGKFVDFASIAGVCILPAAQAIANPGFQSSGPCIPTPIAQSQTTQSGQSTTDTSAGAPPSSQTQPLPSSSNPPPPPPSS